MNDELRQKIAALQNFTGWRIGIVEFATATDDHGQYALLSIPSGTGIGMQYHRDLEGLEQDLDVALRLADAVAVRALKVREQ